MERLILALILACSDQANGGSATQDPPRSATKNERKGAVEETSPPASTDFIIGFDDVLAVNVWKEPELSVKDVVVRPDGKITLPLISDIQASGLTTQELQARITEKLKEYVAAPAVTVIVTKISSSAVSIIGEITRPGVYSLGSPMTVLELIARAGGFREFANTKKIRILRTEGGKNQQFPFNYRDISRGKSLDQNIVLKRGDVVIVP